MKSLDTIIIDYDEININLTIYLFVLQALIFRVRNWDIKTNFKLVPFFSKIYTMIY